MKEKNLERLYKLLERAERERDTEAAAALRWAIFELERGQNHMEKYKFITKECIFDGAPGYMVIQYREDAEPQQQKARCPQMSAKIFVKLSALITQK